MDDTSNPIEPPSFFSGDIGSFAAHYRVDASKTKLAEFRNMSGKPFIGTLAWLAMQSGLLRLDKQIVDGPRPFATDQCNINDLRDPVRSRLLEVADSAEELGFHTRTVSMSNSTGVNVHGGAIRMLHDSGHSFLQIVASSSGSAIQGYEIIVSATMQPVAVFTSTNGRPNYATPAGVTTHRRIGMPLEQLLAVHTKLAAGFDNLFPFKSIADVAIVMDHLAHLFFKDKVERGIFIPAHN